MTHNNTTKHAIASQRPKTQGAGLPCFIHGMISLLVSGAAYADALVQGPLPLPGPLQHISPGDIRVGGEIGRRIDLTIEKNLLALDYEKDFLRPFREPVACPRSASDREAFNKSGRKLFNGLGETIDAAVYFAAYSKDPRVLQLKDRLINAVLKTQRDDGYIGQFTPTEGNRQFFDGFAAEDVAFLCLGLANDAVLFGRPDSLDAAKKLLCCFTDAQKHYEHAKGYNYSAISLCEAALVLYRLTGEREYLDIARHTVLGPERTSQAASLLEWGDDPPFDRGWDDARKKDEPDAVTDATGREKRRIWHVYRHLDRMVTQMLLDRVAPDPRYLRMTRTIREALTRPRRAGMSITGGMGSHEGWSEDQDPHGHAESCASAYSVRFFEELINLDEDLRQGDLMERVIYNTLFAAQDPAGRQLRYFTPFSDKRIYYTSDLYCCPGNFRRGISRLPLSVLYRFRNGVAINLYTPCNASVALAGNVTVKVSQETRYPNDGTIRIAISPSKPATFPVHLRLPRWCAGPQVSVNGKPVRGAAIQREWREGDRIELSLPMRWRWVAGRDLQAGRCALMRGPVVYCLSRSKNSLPEKMRLRDITLDPASVTAPQPDTTIRPDGLRCRVKGWSPGKPLAGEPDLELALTEFPDPTGEEIYFRLSDPEPAAGDELVEREPARRGPHH
ncbi:MAG TPA: beta-L-arabinofuranosidase domain-containing protein [Planctomycetota bacterium]|nr:beta-L-arabinofuranosidase domain-containing protein [Planctomycetota bacterium]